VVTAPSIAPADPDYVEPFEFKSILHYDTKLGKRGEAESSAWTNAAHPWMEMMRGHGQRTGRWVGWRYDRHAPCFRLRESARSRTATDKATRRQPRTAILTEMPSHWRAWISA
jgi:hypothetical protein